MFYFLSSDSFLRSRASTDHEATAMIKTQFMSFWDGLMTDKNTRVMIMGATNRAANVDAAILRRMPSMFKIGLPVCSKVIYKPLIIYEFKEERTISAIKLLIIYVINYSDSET